MGQQHSVIRYDDICADGVTVPGGLVCTVAGALTLTSGAKVCWRHAMFATRAGKCGGCGAETRGGFCAWLYLIG